MLPPMWTHPACMNMDVKMVRKSPPGLARKRLGTNAHVSIKASPPINSTRKKSTLSAIRAYVIKGTSLLPLLSSPMGNMRSTLNLMYRMYIYTLPFQGRNGRQAKESNCVPGPGQAGTERRSSRFPAIEIDQFGE